jgi:uncharacterized membrane protein YtjA (UPF0391 family)
MLSWALMFLVAAIVTGIFGFGAGAGAVAWTAQVLSVLFVVFSLTALLTERKPPVT